MHILYLGDNAGTSAEYLKDVLTELEHTYDHVDANKLIPTIQASYDTTIISDYPAHQLSESNVQQLSKFLDNGKRLIMLGGWDSFNGRGTNYANHSLAKLLPVNLQNEDDRVNAHQGLFLEKDAQLTSDIPIDWQNPPIVCGYNAVEVKPDANVVLWLRPIQYYGDNIELLEKQPLMVSIKQGQGTSVAFLTDLAPHWCGGLVDWGSERRTLPHSEVGDMYIQFIQFLLTYQI